MINAIKKLLSKTPAPNEVIPLESTKEQDAAHEGAEVLAKLTKSEKKLGTYALIPGQWYATPIENQQTGEIVKRMYVGKAFFTPWNDMHVFTDGCRYYFTHPSCDGIFVPIPDANSDERIEINKHLVK